MNNWEHWNVQKKKKKKKLLSVKGLYKLQTEAVARRWTPLVAASVGKPSRWFSVLQVQSLKTVRIDRYKKTDEWYIEWQRVTTSGTTRDNELQRMTTSNNKWQRETTNDKKWQRVVILANFLFSWIREEPTTMHTKITL